MQNLQSTNDLGSGKVRQISINEKIDVINIQKILNENLEVFKKIDKKLNDEYSNILINYLINNNKLNFPLSKHIELFISKNYKDAEKLYKYLLFRLKFYITGSQKVNIGYPPYLLLEPVSACNLRCPFCYQSDKSFTRKPFMGVMDFELFKKIIDDANDIGVGAITLASRGEPTMHKKFIDMLDYLNKKENIFEVKLNTNGSFLTNDMCHGIFKNNLTQIVISADHYIKEDYERLRKGSNFEKITKNVDMLFNIRKKYYPESSTEIRVSGIDNEKNLNREKFKEYWIKRSDHVSAGYPIERWDTYMNAEHPDINDPCEFLWDRMYVWFDGKTNPCDADYKSLLSFGNMSSNSIKEIWNGKIIENTRNMHVNGDRKKVNPCNKCGVTF